MAIGGGKLVFPLIRVATEVFREGSLYFSKSVVRESNHSRPRQGKLRLRAETQKSRERKCAILPWCLLEEVTAAFQTADNTRMKALVKRVASLPAMQMRTGAP